MAERTIFQLIREKVEVDVPETNLEEMGVEPKDPYGPGLKGVFVLRRAERTLNRKITVPPRQHEGD